MAEVFNDHPGLGQGPGLPTVVAGALPWIGVAAEFLHFARSVYLPEEGVVNPPKVPKGS
jgi:hypothetical protein